MFSVPWRAEARFADHVIAKLGVSEAGHRGLLFRRPFGLKPCCAGGFDRLFQGHFLRHRLGRFHHPAGCRLAGGKVRLFRFRFKGLAFALEVLQRPIGLGLPDSAFGQKGPHIRSLRQFGQAVESSGDLRGFGFLGGQQILGFLDHFRRGGGREFRVLHATL